MASAAPVLEDYFKAKYSDQFSDGPPITKKTCGEIPLISLEVLSEVTVTLAQLFAGLRFYSYQKIVSKAMVECVLRHNGDVLTDIQSRQSGKTEAYISTLAAILIFFPFLAQVFPEDWRFNLTDEEGRYRGFKKGIRVGVYAPSADLADIPAKRMTEMLQGDVFDELLREMEVTWRPISNGFRFSNGSSIVFKTAEKKAKKEGHTYDILVLDEDQDMDPVVVIKSLHPFVAATKGCIFKYGTGFPVVCDLYTAIRTNKELQMLPRSPQLHFEFPWEVCAKENSLYGEFVERERQRIGEESDEFLMSYCCKFILEKGMFIEEKVLIGETCAIQNNLMSLIWKKDMRAQDSPLSLVAGIDFAKADDATVLTIAVVDWENPEIDTVIEGSNGNYRYQAFQKHVVCWKEWNGVNYEQQFGEIQTFLENFISESRVPGATFSRVGTDATGLGEVATDRLIAILPFKVVPFVFSSSFKSDGYKLLSNDLLSGRLSFPYGEEARDSRMCRSFIHQLLDLRKEWQMGRMVVKHAPSKHARDDYPDSLMIVNWLANSADVSVVIDDVDLYSGQRSRPIEVGKTS